MYALIDSDPELSRGDFFENVLDAFASDGKLYSLAPGCLPGRRLRAGTLQSRS